MQTRLLLQTALIACCWTIFFLLLLLGLTGVIVGGVAYTKATEFSSYAGLSTSELRSILGDGLNSAPTTTAGHKTILLLGVDELGNRPNAPTLTDTMMLISLDLERGSVTTLSLPRDLWSDAYQTKVNALYEYGKTRYPDKPSQFTTEVIQEITGVPIHHTVVVKLEHVSEIIDMLGGVTVTVETAFTDPLFPRDDVDIQTISDPAILYKTVVFDAGEQVLDGTRALEYIRSRHSTDTQGTDDARAARQQAVLKALVAKATTTEILLDMKTMGSLFRLYNEHFGADFPPQESIATVKALAPFRNSLVFSQKAFPIAPDDPLGVITHPQPSRAQQNQWVYVITDSRAFSEYAQNALEITAQ